MSDPRVTPCFSLPVPKPVREMTDDERSAFAEQIVTTIFGAGPVEDAELRPPLGARWEAYQRHVRRIPAPRQ